MSLTQHSLFGTAPVSTPSQKSDKRIQSTQDAMSVLEKQRRHVIDEARRVARELIAADGSTHTRVVRAEMAKRGLLPTKGKEFWLGCVFNNSDEFEWTGETATYSDPARNIHERTVKLWRLKVHTAAKVAA